MPNDDVNQKRDKSLKKRVYRYYYVHEKRSWHDYVKPPVFGQGALLCVDFVNDEMMEIKDLLGRLRDDRDKNKNDT